jgi:hypothetical protein
LKDEIPIPAKIKQKIVGLLKIPSLEESFKNSKIWKVDLHQKFIYVNDIKNKE